MEYIPSAPEQEQQRLFAKKRSALKRIGKLGITLPYISATFSYEQLLSNYIILDISNSETEYLKQGIEALVKCLRIVQNEPIIQRKDIEDEVYKMRGGNLDKLIAEQGENSDVYIWVNERIEIMISNDVSSKKITEEVLLREISEFKIRLGRVNVVMKMENDVFEFTNSNKMMEFHIYEKEIIDNPHPNIFENVEGYLLFQSLYSIYKDIEKPLANYSFIYRQLSKDKYIKESFKPEKFREWINSEPYNANVDTKFKTYDNCYTKEKFNFYQFVKSKH
jgi:hypothetical protein